VTYPHKITVHQEIDMAHRVVGHAGKCARLHGHRWQFDVLVAVSHLEPIGFVCDYGVIKDTLNRWDHRTLLWDDDPMVFAALGQPLDRQGVPEIEEAFGIIRVPLNPTSENLSILAHQAITALVAAPSRVKVTVRETPSTSSVYGGEL
jgi:6-pyruvoyltetrahydropterin/6-carboxytetrahydropterin synthase